MPSDIDNILTEKAKQLFGDERAKELQPDIEKTAAELSAIHSHPIHIENEP
jgi:hypothetical protein